MAPLLFMLLSLISAFQLAQGEQPAEEELITTKDVQLLGGWSKRNPENAEIQDAAQFAVEKYNSKSKAKKFFRLLTVTSAETQVTNMINYKIEATVGKTKCLKSDNAADVESCVLGKKRLMCTFEVRFDPRTNKHDLVSSSCMK